MCANPTKFKRSKTSAMNEMKIFENAQFGQIRTSMTEQGEPLFCLVDVCRTLALTNPSDVKRRLQQRGVCTIDTPTANQYGATVMQQMNFITEPNLYKCIFQSRKKEAEAFQDWVCGEILPSIRTNGGYVATHQADTPELIMARALQVAQSTIEKHARQLEAAKATITSQSEQLKEQAPKVEYADNVLKSVNTYTSTQMAKELDLRTAEQLHGLLRGWGVMIRQSGQWLLAARYCGQGYTKARTSTYTRSDGSQGTNTITVWTEHGRWFLHQLFARKGGKA